LEIVCDQDERDVERRRRNWEDADRLEDTLETRLKELDVSPRLL
jgi:hypothetical protein